MATVNVAVVLPAAVFFVIALAGIWIIGYLFVPTLRTNHASRIC
jgi:hypothetical protein